MKYLVAYHNAKKMGYSCVDIPEPRVQTKNDVSGLEHSKVWLIAGEGESPKTYYLAGYFTVKECLTNSYPSTDFPHLIKGPGHLFGKSIPLAGNPVLAEIRRESANFVRGLYETKNSKVISALQKLA